MSTGFAVAIGAIPFIEKMEEEVEALAAKVLDAPDGAGKAAAMDGARRRLAMEIKQFVDTLPAVVRNDGSTARAAAYALAGLADERMLHHPAGGLDGWGERLLEHELYGSALAGQVVIDRAREAAWGAGGEDGAQTGHALAPLYLAVLRTGFEGALRGRTLDLANLVGSLEESIRAGAVGRAPKPPEQRPMRSGVPPVPLALAGVVLWLAVGAGVWGVLAGETLRDAQRLAQRLEQGRAGTGKADVFEDRIGPWEEPAARGRTGGAQGAGPGERANP